MLALAVVLMLGVAIGLLRGGSFDNLRRIRLRRLPVLFGALGLQVLAQVVPAGADRLAFALVVASFGMIFVWAAANARATGMAFIGLGALLNLIVILANGGMPISAEAAARAGYVGEEAERLVIRGKHIIDHDGDARLAFLSDRIPLGGHPSAASVGDLVLWAGLVLLIQGSMARPRGRRSAQPPADGDHTQQRLPPEAPDPGGAPPGAQTGHVRITRPPRPYRG